LFYDAEKKGVDFLIQRELNEIVPVEVSIGDKGKGQIKRAVNKYQAEYGIIISNTNEVRREDDIIYIPLTFFSFV